MRRTILTAIALHLLLCLTPGCSTTVSVNFGNGLAKKVRVRSSESGQAVEVEPNQFGKLSNTSGDLIVSTQSGEVIKFTRVAPFDVKYHTLGNSIFGPNSVTLKVMLETNMQLYVVKPGKLTLDTKEEQPAGYPKTGQRVED
jgi:hypothetical protein